MYHDTRRQPPSIDKPDLGELYLCLRITKLLHTIDRHGEGHFRDAVDWCENRLNEESRALANARDQRAIFGGNGKIVDAVRQLTGSRLSLVQAAEIAVRHSYRHEIIIEELENFAWYYKIPLAPPQPTRRAAG